MAEKTTSEVAAMLGIRPDLLRKWKKRGFLSKAPAGVSGQGRSVECHWSDEAIQEVRDRLASRPNQGTRYPRALDEATHDR
jgi:hypothetical protein